VFFTELTYIYEWIANFSANDSFSQNKVTIYVEGVGQKSGPCTATFNDKLHHKMHYWNMHETKVLVL
jgi:hypothetical protein